MTQKFEYRWFQATDGLYLDTLHLNARGAEGWRAVSVISRPGLVERILMERSIPVPAPAKKKGVGK